MGESGKDFNRAVSFLLTASILAGAFSFFYQLVMGNHLNEKYAELMSILSLFTILTIPAQTISLVLSRNVNNLKAQGREEELSGLLRSTYKFIIIGGIIGACALLISIPILQDFLKISDPMPIILISVSLAISVIDPVGTGSAQGLQRFRWIGFQTSIGPTIKLLLGSLFVVGFAWGVTGAVAGVVLGAFASLTISVMAIKDYLAVKGKPYPLSGVKRFIAPVLFAVICFSILTNIDVILAKHYFTDAVASNYSAAATIAKVILFLPTAVCAVMFPKLSDAHVRNKDTMNIMNQAIRTTFIISSLAAIACVLFPETIVHILYPNQAGAAEVLRILGFAMTFFSLSQLFMNYALATDTHIFLYVLGGFMALEVGLMIVFHSAPVDIAWSQFVAGAGIVLISYIYTRLEMAKA
ncbi:MAG: Polysaccharide biosynthesis protein [Methanomassiliicoccales archaeon PtaU1.Bin124]|nr:MAG: Polysaccharide biosynthesis protein [Methanomassiliicoccales archaeon PtaU1.Bin124]